MATTHKEKGTGSHGSPSGTGHGEKHDQELVEYFRDKYNVTKNKVMELINRYGSNKREIEKHIKEEEK